MVVDRVRREGPGQAVVQHDVDQRKQERQPRLVEGHDCHHYEEVEVHLDQTVEEMHERSRAGEQAQRGQCRPGRDVEPAELGAEREPGHQGSLRQSVHQALPAEQADERQARSVQPQQGTDATVARLPLLQPQGPALRQPADQGASERRWPASR